jgi:hypothetical protein
MLKNISLAALHACVQISKNTCCESHGTNPNSMLKCCLKNGHILHGVYIYIYVYICLLARSISKSTSSFVPQSIVFANSQNRYGKEKKEAISPYFPAKKSKFHPMRFFSRHVFFRANSFQRHLQEYLISCSGWPES